MTAETYNGWANRETWAVALHIDNDQGWQESVHEALRNGLSVGEADASLGADTRPARALVAGEIIRENVEEALDLFGYVGDVQRWMQETLADIGSLYRVDWDALGAYYLADLAEVSS